MAELGRTLKKQAILDLVTSLQNAIALKADINHGHHLPDPALGDPGNVAKINAANDGWEIGVDLQGGGEGGTTDHDLLTNVRPVDPTVANATRNKHVSNNDAASWDAKLSASALTAQNVSYAGSTNLSAANVEAALDELDTEKASAQSLTDHVAHSDPHTGYQKESEKGVANGYASLDAGGKVPTAQIPGTESTVKWFHVARTSSQSLTLNGTDEKMLFNSTVVASLGDCGSYASSTFTAAKSGVILIGALWRYAANATNRTAALKVYKNGAVYGYLEDHQAGTVAGGMAGSMPVMVTVNDIVEIYAFQSSGGNEAKQDSHFWGIWQGI